MVTTSAPNLRVHNDAGGKPLDVTFVVYFKLADGGEYDNDEIKIVSEGEIVFEPLEEDDYNPYHLVKIACVDGLCSRTTPSFADGEVIPEAEYDWSEVPGALQPDEDALSNHRRTTQFWIDHRTSPDPGAYMVEPSPWIAELGPEAAGLQHYLILGQDHYVEVIARSATQHVGQGVD